nr:hypothetical protein [Tanacetum cinerariifolium]
HELDEPRTQDIYSKVMGNNKNGTAEMYGLGVRACDVWGVVQSSSARRRDKIWWKSNVGRLSIELAKYKAKGSTEARVGLQVYLTSISNSKIVAKGWIRSLDPDAVVRSEEIGSTWCERQFGAFPGDLLLGMTLPPGKRRWRMLVRDSFPSDNPRRKGGSHIFSIQELSATVAHFPRRHVAGETSNLN